MKKRLAYSTVSQVSYVIFGLMLFHPVALAGALLQVIFHAVAKKRPVPGHRFGHLSDPLDPGIPDAWRRRGVQLHHVEFRPVRPVSGGHPAHRRLCQQMAAGPGGLEAGDFTLACWGIGVLMVSAC